MQSQTVGTDYRSVVVPRGAEHHSDLRGLDHDVKPYDLLRLVRDVGHRVGLTGGDLQHLDYLISHTRDVDWEAGERPIVYKSVCVMARERGVSERQIHHREAKLHRLGCLVWNDMGNFRRSGGRDREGRIAFAYGVDLSPLAKRHDEFVVLKEQQTQDMARFNEARRQVSAVRRRVLVKIAAAQERAVPVETPVERLGALPRVRAGHSLTVVNDLLDRLREIETALDEALADAPLTCGLNQNTSDRSEQNFRHIQPTNNPQSAKADTCNRPVASRSAQRACQPVVHDRKEGGNGSGDPGPVYTGAGHLTLRQVMLATSEAFCSLITPTGRELRTGDIVEAAARRCHGLGIHRSAWIDACSVMGRWAAAVAVVIIDRNLDHPACPVVRPGGVLRAMTARAQTGELHLHRSIFGILNRDAEGGAS